MGHNKIKEYHKSILLNNKAVVNICEYYLQKLKKYNKVLENSQTLNDQKKINSNIVLFEEAIINLRNIIDVVLSDLSNQLEIKNINYYQK
jgi:hypothetical protein